MWRPALLLILSADLLAHVVFLFEFVVSPADYCLTSAESVDYLDLQFVAIQLVAALLSTGLVFLGLSLTLRPVHEGGHTERWLAVGALQLLALSAESAGLTGVVSSRRRSWVLALVGAQALAAAVALAGSLLAGAQRPRELPVDLADVDTSPAFRQLFEDSYGKPSLEKLERFLEMRSVRGSIRLQARARCSAQFCGAIFLRRNFARNSDWPLRRPRSSAARTARSRGSAAPSPRSASPTSRSSSTPPSARSRPSSRRRRSRRSTAHSASSATGATRPPSRRARHAS